MRKSNHAQFVTNLRCSNALGHCHEWNDWKSSANRLTWPHVNFNFFTVCQLQDLSAVRELCQVFVCGYIVSDQLVKVYIWYQACLKNIRLLPVSSVPHFYLSIYKLISHNSYYFVVLRESYKRRKWCDIQNIICHQTKCKEILIGMLIWHLS